MQLSFHNKEIFYHELAQMMRSGIPFLSALGFLTEGRGRIRRVAREMLEGEPTDAAMCFRNFSPLDRQIVAAGEGSGRLEETFDRLSEHYAILTKARRQVIRGLIYPLIVLHLGAVLLAVPSAILDGGLVKFIEIAGGILGGFYVVVLLIYFAVKIISTSVHSSVVADRILRTIPGFGGFWRDTVMSRFCLVLSLGLRSAAGVLGSLDRAALASRSAWVRQVATSTILIVQQGGGFSDSLRRSGAFPEELERAFLTSEQSGRMEEEMTRWAATYQSSLVRRIEWIAKIIPGVVYMMVVVVVAWRIFSVMNEVSTTMRNLIPEDPY